jgi:hypothetical protein
MFPSLLDALKILSVPGKQNPDEKNRAKAAGLYTQLRKFNFVASMLMMSDILPVLTTLSKTFQDPALTFGDIPNHISKTRTRLVEACDMNGSYFRSLPTYIASLRKRKHVICSDEDLQNLTSGFSTLIRKPFEKSLLKHLSERFPPSTPLADLGEFFTPSLYPQDEALLGTYPPASLKRVIAQFARRADEQEPEDKDGQEESHEDDDDDDASDDEEEESKNTAEVIHELDRASHDDAGSDGGTGVDDDGGEVNEDLGAEANEDDVENPFVADEDEDEEPDEANDEKRPESSEDDMKGRFLSASGLEEEATFFRRFAFGFFKSRREAQIESLCAKGLSRERAAAQTTPPSMAEFLSHILSNATTYKTLFPNFTKLAAIAAVIITNTAECERAFSTMKRIKSRFRIQLLPSTLDDLMRISIAKAGVDYDVSAALRIWASRKKRKIRIIIK